MSLQVDKAPFLGVLMLDTAFPRGVGDAGNAASYPFPTKIKRVPEADAVDVVQAAGPSRAMLPRFRDAAVALEADGAVGLVSTCGFWCIFRTTFRRLCAFRQ